MIILESKPRQETDWKSQKLMLIKVLKEAGVKKVAMELCMSETYLINKSQEIGIQFFEGFSLGYQYTEWLWNG